MTKKSLAAGYQYHDEQQRHDQVETNLSHTQEQIDRLRALIADEEDRQEAARELLAVAEEVLAGPPQLEVTPAARGDKRDAEKVIAEATENIAQLKTKLVSFERAHAVWEQRRKELNFDVLRSARQLDTLRRRLR